MNSTEAITEAPKKPYNKRSSRIKVDTMKTGSITRTRKISFRITDQALEGLKQTASEKEISVSEYIRILCSFDQPKQTR